MKKKKKIEIRGKVHKELEIIRTKIYIYVYNMYTCYVFSKGRGYFQ